jgi:hypothetical protein
MQSERNSRANSVHGSSSKFSSFSTAHDQATPHNENILVLKPARNPKCGLGVFTKYACPSRTKIIDEAPLVSSIFWGQRHGKRDIAKVWEEALNDISRDLIRARFQQLRDVPDLPTRKHKDRKKLERFVEQYAFWDTSRTKAHIYWWTSMINHACVTCANAEFWITPERAVVRLVKPLAADEELFIHYNRAGLAFGCAVCSKGGPKGLRCLPW